MRKLRLVRSFISYITDRIIQSYIDIENIRECFDAGVFKDTIENHSLFFYIDIKAEYFRQKDRSDTIPHASDRYRKPGRSLPVG